MKATHIEYPNGVRVAKRPDRRGYYRVKWADGDARRREWADALALAQDVAYFQGATGRGAAPVPYTVGELAEAWLDPNALHRRPWSPGYRHTTEKVTRLYVLPHLADVDCHEWDRRHTSALLTALDLAPSTLALVRATLSVMATWGRENGYLRPDQRPTEGITLAPQPAYGDLPTVADVEALADAMRGEWWRRLQIHLLAYVGLRPGEMLALTGEQIDLELGTVCVDRQLGGVPKGGKIRTAVFPMHLDPDIRKRLGEVGPGLLFPGRHHRDRPQPYSSFVGQHFTPARERAGWPKKPNGKWLWTPHTLRHFYCTWALSKSGLNLDVGDVTALVGHHSTAFTYQRYVGPMQGTIQRAREASEAISIHDMNGMNSDVATLTSIS